MKLPWAYTIGAIILGVGAFTIGGAEIIALVNGVSGDTASEHVWGMTWQLIATISGVCVALAVFFGWLAIHFWQRRIEAWIRAFRQDYERLEWDEDGKSDV